MPPKSTKSGAPTPRPRKTNPTPKPKAKPMRARKAKRRPATTPRTSLIKQYMMCRLDPLGPGTSIGIPDSSSGKRIVVDVRTYYDIKFSSSGTLDIVMIPSTSTPLLIKDSVAASTGGIVDVGYTNRLLTTSRPGNTSGAWLGIPNTIFSAYIAQNPSAPQSVQHPYYASSFRIVSEAARITYTGKPFEASGLITVTPGENNSLGEEQNFSAITRYDSSGTAIANYAAQTVQTRLLDFNLNKEPINGSVTGRLSEGMYILNKRKNPVSLFQDTPVTPIVLVEEDRATSLLAGAATGLDTVADYDAQWMTPSITLRGAQAGESVRIETVVCVEYVLDARSAFAPLASDRPVVNPNSIQTADRKIASAPIAAHPSTWKTIVGDLIETGAGMIAGALGGPAAGAAMGTITSTFRRMLL